MDTDVNAINLAQLREPVGIQCPSYEMDIERGKIREFSRSVYSNHPAYILGENPIVPATFLPVGEYGWGHWVENPESTMLSRIPFDL